MTKTTDLYQPPSVLIKSQTKEFEFRKNLPGNETIKVKLRYDDDCNNGHNTFSITGEIYEGYKNVMGGCIHEEIEKHFPELAHLIKWHLVSSDGPMHYIENTCYHASDRDCWGLQKGEFKQTVNGKTGLPCWVLEEKPGAPTYVDAEEKPQSVTFNYVPFGRTGEGKERELDAARRCAVWPDATNAQLCLPKEELTELLLARLPLLLLHFKHDMEAQGFKY